MEQKGIINGKQLSGNVTVSSGDIIANEFVIRAPGTEKWCFRISANGNLEFNPEMLENKDELVKNVCDCIEKEFVRRNKKKTCYCICAELSRGLCRERGYVFAYDAEDAKQKVIDYFINDGAEVKDIIKCDIASSKILDFYVTFFIE